MSHEPYINGDYCYRFVSDDTIEITHYSGHDSKVEIPETLDFLAVVSISEGAFQGCSRLTHVVIPNGIQSVGSKAFCNCSALASIRLSSSVLSIAESAFEGCADSLVFAVYPNSEAHRWIITNHRPTDVSSCFFLYGFYTEWPECAVVEKYTGNGGEICLPHELDGYPVVCVWEKAFKGCRSLTGMEFPEGLEAIAEEAFANCSSLTHLVLPKSLKHIGSRAFSACTALHHVIIPSSVTAIGFDVFEDCADNLTLVVDKDSYAHHWAENMKYAYIHSHGEA